MLNTNAVRKAKLLVAVSPPAPFPVVEHLFRGRPEFELVESRRGLRQFPDLIVVQRRNPKSKLILFCPGRGYEPPALRDACLDEERLLGRVMRMARELSATDR